MRLTSEFSFLAKFGLIFIPIVTIGFPIMAFTLPPPDKIPQITPFLFVYILFVLLMYWIMSNFKYVVIKKKKIGFRKIFSKKLKYISFKQLDGYIESRVSNEYGQNYDVLYLIKNGKKVAWICAAYYDNYYQLQENLVLERLGEESPGIFRQALDYFEMVKYSRKYLDEEIEIIRD